MPGFLRVMDAVDDAWRERRGELLEQAEQLARGDRGDDARIGGRRRTPRRSPEVLARSRRRGRRAVRPAVRRVRARAEVPAGDDARRSSSARAVRDPSPATLADDHGLARRDGRGRHVRPGRRRLPPLLGRRVLAGAPLREDALRPGAARRARTCTGGWSPVEPRYRRDRRGDDRVRAARPAPRRRRLLLGRGRRLRRRRGQVLPVVARRDRGDRRRRRRRGDPVLRRDRRRELRGPAHRRTAATSCTSSTARRIRPTSVHAGDPAPARPRDHARPARPRRQGPARLERAVPPRARRGGRRARARRLDGRRARRTPRFLLRELRRDDGRLLRSWQDGRAASPRVRRGLRRARSRRCSRWPRSTTSRGSPRRARVADELVRLFADDDRRRLLHHRHRRRGADRAPEGLPGQRDAVRELARRRRVCCGSPRSPATTGYADARRRGGSRARRPCSASTRPRSRTCSARSSALVTPSLEVAVVGALDDPATVALRREVRRPTAPRVGARHRTTRIRRRLSRRCSPTAPPSTAPDGIRLRALRVPPPVDRPRRAPHPARRRPRGTHLSPTHAFWRQA